MYNFLSLKKIEVTGAIEYKTIEPLEIRLIVLGTYGMDSTKSYIHKL